MSIKINTLQNVSFPNQSDTKVGKDVKPANNTNANFETSSSAKNFSRSRRANAKNAIITTICLCLILNVK